MLKYKMQFLAFMIALNSAALSSASESTWYLDEEQNWRTVSEQSQDKLVIAVAEVKKLVNTGQTKAAGKAFKTIKEDFSKSAGRDLDLFIKAELLLSKRKLAKSARTYDKLLKEFPQTKFRDMALDRMFSIGTAYLGGQKRHFLGIKFSGYAEGVKIMEKVTDRVGIDSTIGIEAALAVARNYEQREKFHEAYLKWWEISLEWQTGLIGRDALLGMAQSKQAIYNKNPEYKRPFYDASCLKSAKSYYEKFKLLYPEDAKALGVDNILKEITEQLAFKEYIIGQYYRRTGNKQSANLYFDEVVSDWPDSTAAKIVKEMLNRKPTSD